MKPITFVWAITTCWGKEQLIESVKSLRADIGMSSRIILAADNIPLSENIKNSLKNLNVEFFENPVFTSAFNKQKQILERVSEDLVIFSQDDMLVDKDLNEEIINAFQNDKNLTYLCVHNKPLPPQTFFERGTAAGVRITNQIAALWNKGDNYLAALGRIMAFRTDWIKNLDVITDSVSLDAYIYFENKKLGGNFKCVWNKGLWFRAPQNMSEQLKKSSRFQNSQLEMESYKRFNNLQDEYRYPALLGIKAILLEMIKDPIGVLIYFYIYAYTRFFRQKPKTCLTALWDVDTSTKNLIEATSN